jgi:transposase
MAVSLYQKTIRGHRYWYARECQRVEGQPRIVWQQYLGKADAIATAVATAGAAGAPPRPRETVLAEFGALAALYDLTQQLDLVATIDRHAGKRAQGVSVGTYVTLAALNRCVAPTSKARLADWYAGTVLRRLLPVPPRALSSQRFWDHLSYLDAPQIAAIEADLTQTLVGRFGVDVRCLLYDTTNFATFIDTFNLAPTLAQRGHSKQKRSDLRLVGLALLVSRDCHVPLFHQVYAGNVPDAPTLAGVLDTLVDRYRLLATAVDDITVVFDKGNNSAANLRRLDETAYHVVGSLSPVQHRDLLALPRRRFRRLTAPDLPGLEVCRTTKTVLGAPRIILVTYNPALYATQHATVVRELHKATGRLHTLQRQLAAPPTGRSRRSAAAVEQDIRDILRGRHLSDLVAVTLDQGPAGLRLHYHVRTAAWRHLQRTLLGKTILFTDQATWSDEEIVRAYRSQHHIEAAFKRMKDPHFVSWRPLFHWTDQKIRVHAFYCVLALLLTALLRRRLVQQGLDLSVTAILQRLTAITEVALLYPGTAAPVITYNRLTLQQRRLVTLLDLDRFHAA